MNVTNVISICLVIIGMFTTACIVILSGAAPIVIGVVVGGLVKDMITD